MIEGLSQDAQLRLKVVLEGIQKARSDLDGLGEQLDTDLRRDFERVTGKIVEMENELRDLGGAGKKAGGDLAAGARTADEAWKKALKTVQDSQDAFAKNARGKVTGSFEDGAKPLSSLTEEQKQHILDVDDAASANIISAIRQERAEREKLSSETVSAEARMEAAINRTAEAERARARAARRTDEKSASSSWDQNFKSLSNDTAKTEAENARAVKEAADAEARMEDATKKRAAAERLLNRQRIAADNRAAAKAFDEEMRAALAASDATGKHTENLISQRYALYDVSTTATVTGAGLLALVGAYEAVAVARQRAFADVRRTAGFDADTGEIGQLTELRKELVGLTQKIPETFGKIAETASVGGQLGVAAEDVAKYTESVTKFSTLSGIAAEQSGLRLGRLVNILGLNADGYELLARSISFAGTESAATEDQILSVAAEIAPYARQVGFAATETVGLATALASLQVPPERARSAIQDMFRAIDGAVTAGGAKLRNYAAISGMTVDQFVAEWKSKPADALRAFTEGFSSVDNATQALNQLGLDGQRVAPVLLSLSNNADLVKKSFQDAADGVNNGFMDKAFAVTVGTVAAQIQILVNELGNFADAAGGPTLQALLGLVVGAQKVLQVLTALAQTPMGQFLSIIVTGLATLLGALLLIVGGAAATGASLLALKTAVAGLDGQLPPAVAKVVNLVLALFGLQVEARKAAPALVAAGAGGAAAGAGLETTAVGARAARVAIIGLLGSTGVGPLLTLLGSMAAEGLNAASSQKELSDAMATTNDKTGDQAGLMLEDADAIRDAVAAANEFKLSQADMEGALFSLGQSMQKHGRDFSIYSTGGRDNMKALESVISSATKTAGGDSQLLANLLLGVQQQLVATGASADAIDAVQRAIEATGKAATDATITSNSLAVGLDFVDASARKAGKGVNDLGEKIRTVSDYARDLGSILSDSVTFRFGSSIAYDKVLSQYSRMRKEAADATKSVDDLRRKIRDTEAELTGLGADRTGLEYSLAIASQYGDTIRASELASQIAKIDSDAAAKRADLSNLNGELITAQDALNYSLAGNSDAAVAARDNVLKLVTAYEEYLTALANSGVGQDDLKTKAQELRTEFENQLTQMGYSSDEVNEIFSPAFQGFSDIIERFPRNVTLDANVDPAQRALDEFLAKNAEKKIDVDITADQNEAYAQGTAAGEALGRGIPDGIKKSGREREGGGTFTSPKDDPWGYMVSTIWSNFWNWGEDIRNPFAGFADGGYTGDGAKYDVAGPVHKGEFVFSQEATRYFGVNNLARWHAAGRSGGGFANGGTTGGTGNFFGAGPGGLGAPISLAQESVERIADAVAQRPAMLWADGRALAKTASAGNASISRGI
ncbi:phage tail tape measure protein [Microbacterium sp. T32]|uniref:phage tail tape measure protein n=1 Tax=Microbacterium sp. T32 TaxID=1776083 RepID=UPI0007ABF4A2|nr:phage tail tape measure protein [Microbacterium sp. T32]KZE41431.1 hypothetical protein AVW09_02245 [Microbacterium sp. T32]